MGPITIGSILRLKLLGCLQELSGFLAVARQVSLEGLRISLHGLQVCHQVQMRHLEVLIGVTHPVPYTEEDAVEGLEGLLVVEVVTDLVRAHGEQVHLGRDGALSLSRAGQEL